jgi:uncharacterized protein YunC (DUF1805 family)
MLGAEVKAVSTAAEQRGARVGMKGEEVLSLFR